VRAPFPPPATYAADAAPCRPIPSGSRFGAAVGVDGPPTRSGRWGRTSAARNPPVGSPWQPVSPGDARVVRAIFARPFPPQAGPGLRPLACGARGAGGGAAAGPGPASGRAGYRRSQPRGTPCPLGVVFLPTRPLGPLAARAAGLPPWAADLSGHRTRRRLPRWAVGGPLTVSGPGAARHRSAARGGLAGLCGGRLLVCRPAHPPRRLPPGRRRCRPWPGAVPAAARGLGGRCHPKPAIGRPGRRCQLGRLRRRPFGWRFFAALGRRRRTMGRPPLGRPGRRLPAAAGGFCSRVGVLRGGPAQPVPAGDRAPNPWCGAGLGARPAAVVPWSATARVRRFPARCSPMGPGRTRPRRCWRPVPPAARGPPVAAGAPDAPGPQPTLMAVGSLNRLGPAFARPVGAWAAGTCGGLGGAAMGVGPRAAGRAPAGAPRPAGSSIPPRRRRRMLVCPGTRGRRWAADAPRPDRPCRRCPPAPVCWEPVAREPGVQRPYSPRALSPALPRPAAPARGSHHRRRAAGAPTLATWPALPPAPGGSPRWWPPWLAFARGSGPGRRCHRPRTMRPALQLWPPCGRLRLCCSGSRPRRVTARRRRLPPSPAVGPPRRSWSRAAARPGVAALTGRCRA